MLRCQCPSICPSVTEVHWRIIANLGFKFRSKFLTRIVVTMHAGNTAAAPASEVEAIIRSPTNMAAADGGAISRYASHC